MIVTSPDGQWAAIRRGREVSLLAGGAGPPTAQLELETEDADLIIVGPPSVLVAITRGPGLDRVVLYQPPYLDAVARLDLDQAMALTAVTGSRIVLIAADRKTLTVVRIAGRALSAHPIDPQSPIEFAVGLERNQILLSLLKKLEAWDAVSCRPLRRMQVALPPAPRTIGPAHGHLWAIKPDRDAIWVIRMSDGRPFAHAIGAPIDEVIYHPGSPLLIIATPRGLVRLHCFAHSLTVIDAPWEPGMPLAQLVVGDDISLLGLGPHDDEPWRVPIGGAGAPAITLDSGDAPSEPPLTTAADKLRAMRERTDPRSLDARGGDPRGGDPRGGDARGGEDGPGERGPPAVAHDAPRPTHVDDEPSRPSLAAARIASARDGAAPRAIEPGRARPAWREPVAAYGAELARGNEAEPPVIAVDSELGQLVHQLALATPARRALIALYGLYLIGEPALAVARLAQALGDWPEVLGQGELGAFALLRRRGGRVTLRATVTDLLDGLAPRAIRLAGAPGRAPRPGAFQRARGSRGLAALEAELADELGRLAVVEGKPARAVLEARLHGATAIALAPPPARPAPWPRGASLIVVTDGAPPAWVATLPHDRDATDA
jgi:hypothetical protein